MTMPPPDTEPRATPYHRHGLQRTGATPFWWNLLGVIGAALLALVICQYTEQPFKQTGKQMYAWVTHAKYCPGGVIIRTDTQGIPEVEYGTLNGVYIGTMRNAVQVGDAAIAYYQQRRDPALRARFLACADWLVDHADVHGDAAWYVERFPWPAYHLSAPWRCGLAEGRALSALTLAYQDTNNPRYLRRGRQLVESFYIDTTHGGATYKEPYGWWYEEYAGPGGTQPHVLNGMIFTVMGLHAYAECSHNARAAYLVTQGIRALVHDLPKYRLPQNYSAYDVLGNPAGDYHRTHIDQMGELYALTKNPIFLTYLRQWTHYHDPSFIMMLVHQPTKARILLWLIHTLLLWLLWEMGIRYFARKKQLAVH